MAESQVAEGSIDMDCGARGKVVLFGKTGDGKSTVANALVTGGITDLQFPIGHGVSGCTSEMNTLSGRGWTLTDTVGLGEGDAGTVSNKDAEKMISDFLRRVQGQYTHVIYVKSSSNRFDVLDETIWNSFKRIFKGAEEAFTILLTKGNQAWLDENWEILPPWVKEVGKQNVIITDIPPVSERKVREARNEVSRKVAIEKLEADLLMAHELRGGRYATPRISTMTDSDLEVESRSILEYIKSFLQASYTIMIGTAMLTNGFNAICAVFV